MSGSKNSVFTLVSQFLGQQNNISVPVPLVRMLGDYTAAAFVSQVTYWSDRTNDPDGWFWKTHDQWFEELHLTSDQVRRCVRTADGLVEVKRAGVPAKNYYRINRAALIGRLQDLADETIVSTSRNGETQHLEMDKPNGLSSGNPTASRTADPTSSTKTTTKTTPKKKPSRANAQGGQAQGNDLQAQRVGGLTRDVAPQAAQGTPDGVAADAATLTPDHTSQTPQLPARSETEAATTEKGSAGAAAPATEHQAMMAAIREAVYPGTPRCADKIEQRLAAASKQLRSAGLSVDAPAAIVAHIRARHAWRKYLTPEHVVEHSAEWASLHTKPATTSEAAAPAVIQKGFLR